MDRVPAMTARKSALTYASFKLSDSSGFWGLDDNNVYFFYIFMQL